MATLAQSGPGWRVQLDRISDALTPSQVRRRLEAAQRRIGITRAGQAALVGAIGLWITARVVAGTAIYLVAYGLVLLVVLGYLLAPKRHRVTGERQGLFPRTQEGSRLEVTVHLTAQRRVANFTLEERVPERLGRTVRVPVPRLSRGGELTHRYGLRATRRGVYQVGPLVMVSSDPLGLTERESVVAQPFELLVHPRVELVSDRPLTRQFEDPPIRPPVSRPFPSGLEFYGMRDYVPGDDLRRVVWRAAARTGRVMVREAEQGITDQITILLDTDRGAHSRDGEGLSESFETAVRAAASLGVRHIREGYEVQVETNAGPLTRPLRGAAKQLDLLDALARVEPSRVALSGMTRRLLAGGARGAHAILITPKLTQPDAAALKLVLDRGTSVLVVALLWDDENASTPGVAASLGCQVVGVHPGQDLRTALFNDIGAGNRI